MLPRHSSKDTHPPPLRDRTGTNPSLFGSRAEQWTFAAQCRFIAAASLIIAASMGLLTFLISERTKASTLQSVAEESAALISSVVGPSVQELSGAPRLSPETMAKLDRVLREQLSGRVTAIKIWLQDGTLVYATDKKLIGEKFPSAHLEDAFGGRIAASFDDMHHAENQFDRLLDIPMFEIYAPLYRSGTHDVIAVGEIYRNGDRLASQLKTLQLTSAGLIGAVTIAMMFLLFFITLRANSVISRNKAALTQKMHEAQELASINDRLRLSADEARLEAGHSNERLLAQIGQDLHDGPIQLLSLLMIKLTEPPPVADPSREGGSTDPRTLTARILKEIRDISTGLVLPDLEGLKTEAIIDLAAREHEYLTDTKVERTPCPLPLVLPTSAAVCLFRVIQEGLNNAYHHAGGAGQRLACKFEGGRLHLTISSRGPRKPQAIKEPRGIRPGLGVGGMRKRVEAIGGTFSVTTDAEETQLRVVIPVGEGAVDQNANS